MVTYELPNGQIKILQNDIAEIIFNESAHIDKVTLDKYLRFLITHLEAPFSLLINIINNYLTDSYLLKHLATSKEINVIAVISNKNNTTAIKENMDSYHGTKSWNLMIYSDREKALNWLLQEQDYIHLQVLNNIYVETRN